MSFHRRPPNCTATVFRYRTGDPEICNTCLQLLGLCRQFLRCRRHLFRGAGVLLRHLVQLLNCLVDLVAANALLAAGGTNFGHQFGRLPDVGYQSGQHLAGLARRLDRLR